MRKTGGGNCAGPAVLTCSRKLIGLTRFPSKAASSAKLMTPIFEVLDPGSYYMSGQCTNRYDGDIISHSVLTGMKSLFQGRRGQRVTIERLWYGLDEWQFGDLRLPQGARGRFPLLVLIHGGFWREQYGLDLMEPMAQDFTLRGYATFNVEYRRVGQKGGGWPGTALDAALAIDHVRQIAESFPIDLERITVIGHSAGGHLALWLAGRYQLPPTDLLSGSSLVPISRVVSLAGVVDLEEMWQAPHAREPVTQLMGGPPDTLPAEYKTASPINLLPIGIEQVLVHGTHDDRVPLRQSRHYLQKARALGDKVTLLELEGADHFHLITPNSIAWPPIVAAVCEKPNHLNR